MGGDDAAFVRHPETRQHLVGMTHGVPIGFTAHNDGYERFGIVGHRGPSRHEALSSLLPLLPLSTWERDGVREEGAKYRLDPVWSIMACISSLLVGEDSGGG